MGITAPPGDWSGSGYTFTGNIGRTNYRNPSPTPPPAPGDPSPPAAQPPPFTPPPAPSITAIPLPIDQSSVMYNSLQPSQVRRLE